MRIRKHTRPAVTEAVAAEYEARQAFMDMWEYGFPRCPLTRYSESAGRLADRLAEEEANALASRLLSAPVRPARWLCLALDYDAS
ncbi:hypothetical protein [Embleya sp. NPDC001921]